MKCVVIIILAFIAYNGFSQAERKFVRQGNREYDDKKYQEAEILYRKAYEKNPSSVAADYNLGNALYREKQYESAASRYQGLSEKQKNNEDLNRQYYNMGNALYKAGKYKESIEAYKNALRKLPADTDAKHNLQVALKKLQIENKKKDQQQKNDQKNNDKDNQDKKQQQKDQENKDKQKDQDKNDQQQQAKDKDQSPEKQNVNGQISPADAERILQALENEEKNVLKKVQENQKRVKKVPLEKNW